MSLINKIKTDLTEARYAKDEKRLTFLTTLFSEAARDGLDDGKRDSTDAEVVATIRKFLKGANEIVTRTPDSAAGLAAKWEIDLLNAYLPKQLTEAQIVAEITARRDSGNMTDLKTMMTHFQKHFPGQYDGGLVAKLVRGFIPASK